MIMPKKPKKEKYPYQFYKMSWSWGPIYWRYKNPAGQDFEQDFKEGFCGKWPETDPQKPDVGITRAGKYWVEIVDQSQMQTNSPHCTEYKHFRVLCSEIEWLYEEDMKEL